MMCGAGTDANVILLRYGVLLREYALLALIIKLHGSTKVSAISVFRPNAIQTDLIVITSRRAGTWSGTPPASYC